MLERKPMGEGTGAKTPLVVEIDKENDKKDIEALDIEIPVLTPRAYREYKNLSNLNESALGHQRVTYQHFSEEEQREIVFKDITTSEVTHTTILDTAGIADYRSVIGYFRADPDEGFAAGQRLRCTVREGQSVCARAVV